MARRLILGIILLAAVSSLEAQDQHYLPHLANGVFQGGSIRTTFVFFNNSNVGAQVDLELRGNDGTPLEVELPGEGQGSTFSFILAAGDTRFLTTTGSSGLQEGSAMVTTSAPIGVAAIFSIFDSQGQFLTETGIAVSEPFRNAALAVDSTGDSSTGVALQNLSASPTTVSFDLYQDGNLIGSTNRQLPAMGHLGIFTTGAGGLFPQAQSLRGTLQISSPSDIAALTLRQHVRPLSFTTVPVVNTNSQQTQFLLPQIANGGNIIRTSFVLFSLSGDPASVTLELTDDAGAPYSVTLLGRGTGSRFEIDLDGNGAAFLETDGLGAIRAGAARIVSDVPIGAASFFTILDQSGRFATETGVAASPQQRSFSIPYEVSGTRDTGLAFFNSGQQSATVVVGFVSSFRGGEAVGFTAAEKRQPSGSAAGSIVSIELGPGEHRAVFTSQLAQVSGRGQVSVRSDQPVAALSLRQNSAPLSFTSLPVQPGRYTQIAGSSRESDAISVTVQGVRHDRSSLTVNLPSGFVLSGNLDVGVPFDPLAHIWAQSASGAEVAGVFNPITGRYRIALPGGTWQLFVCRHLSDSPLGPGPGSTSVFLRQQLAELEVTADEIRDLSAALPQLQAVTGTLTALDNLPESVSINTLSLVFETQDGAVGAVVPLDSEQRFGVELPAGDYRVGLLANESTLATTTGLVANPGQTFTLSGIANVSVADAPLSGLNFSVPETASLMGVLVLIEANAEELRVEAQRPDFMTDRCIPRTGRSLAVPDVQAAYRLTLAKDVAHQVRTIRDVAHAGAGESWLYGPPRDVQLGGDMQLDLDVAVDPPLSRLVIFVQDAAGFLANAEITVSSEALAGMPQSQFVATTTTDAFGFSELLLPSGSFTVTVRP